MEPAAIRTHRRHRRHQVVLAPLLPHAHHVQRLLEHRRFGGGCAAYALARMAAYRAVILEEVVGELLSYSGAIGQLTAQAELNPQLS